MTPSWREDKRTTAERGNGGRWQRLSKQFLRQPENALCVMCEAERQTRPANVVDHVIPHKGDQALFWDLTKWQGLCRSHHSRTSRRRSVGSESDAGLGSMAIRSNDCGEARYD
jgi:5-methylcytosine-specific restriction endonuclease McrA